MAWYDMELSTKPYRALRYHQGAVRAAAFHRSYPLFASASDDGSVHVFHGMVYQVSASLLATETLACAQSCRLCASPEVVSLAKESDKRVDWCPGVESEHNCASAQSFRRTQNALSCLHCRT